MDKKDILKNNKLLRQTYNRLFGEMAELKRKVIVPCEFCKHANMNFFCGTTFFYSCFEDKSVDRSDDKK